MHSLERIVALLPVISLSVHLSVCLGRACIMIIRCTFVEFIYFIRSNIQQKQHINTMTREQDSPGSTEH